MGRGEETRSLYMYEYDVSIATFANYDDKCFQ